MGTTAIPPEFRSEADRFPPALRSLLEAELAAGNSIVEVGHVFPAPPAGAYFMLATPVRTRPHEPGGGLTYRAVNGPLYSGFFGDERGFFFLVEPPKPDPESAAGRFERSMAITSEQGRDGIGYDLEILAGANKAELDEIEALLLTHGVKDWRDVEALAALDTPRAREMLAAAILHPNAEISMAVARCAPGVISESERTEALVRALRGGVIGNGLTQALDEACVFHPQSVMDALFEGVLDREGEVAFHFSALLMFLCGQAESPLDWDLRPYFFRFHTEDREARVEAFRDLCEKTGADPSKYL